MRALLITVFIQLGLLPEGLAQAPRSAEEYALKAAYLYQFTHFISWPANTVPPHYFNICLLGDNPFGSALDNLQQEARKGKQVKTLRVETAAELEICQVLYISASESQRRDALLGEVTRQPNMLTVSDMAGFAGAGGMIQFVMEGKHVRFAINIEAATQAGLDISSKLIRLSRPLKERS